MKKYIILASKSKRRAQILSSCGIKYKICRTNAPETITPCKNLSKTVVLNAKTKAEHAAQKYKRHIILGADTLVLLKGKIIGKPENKKHALKILKDYNNSNIDVCTGLYILDSKTQKKASCFDITRIKVAKINSKDLSKFFKHLAPYDKAGGFTIEGIGSILFDNIKGSYFNVLGLPVDKLGFLLKKIGSDIFKFI